ncbi:PAS/PAC sensor-containing diguanylate cyclase [Caballeronia temeraria]|uniref:diguanylate cyclase n=2 Tax=Caballeronia temeraria TaxID=1777137 RepID=A0A158DWS7_9BURK|nr:PAS/PAC sensor-containing diguanylate cyclase [Caballeronia temeraria]
MSEAIIALVAAVVSGDSFLGIYDEEDYLRFANDAFLAAFNLNAGEVATFSSIILDAARDKKGVRIDAADPPSFVKDVQLRRRVATTHPRQCAFPVDFTNDTWYWCTETLLPSGWIVLSGSDMTILKMSERELVASRDKALWLSQVAELTEVPNRRFLLDTLDELMRRATIEGTDLSVALLDLDHFKQINDRFGHEAGDCVLRHFAAHCGASIRDRGFVGRLGGEEFVVVLPRTKVDAAKNALDGLLRSLPVTTLHDRRSETISVSFSAGVTDVRKGERRKDVLLRADKALYLAKQTGRARVEIFKDAAP